MDAQVTHLRQCAKTSQCHLEWLPLNLPRQTQTDDLVASIGEDSRDLLLWAVRQGTATIVSDNLLRASCHLPADVRTLCWTNTTRAQRVWSSYVAQVGRVATALSEAGCHWVLLKGAALALVAYPEPWLRACGDIDVLVRVDDLELAHQTFVKLGFRQDQKYDMKALPKKVRAGRARLHHLPPYFQDTGDPNLPFVTAELHHRITAAADAPYLPAHIFEDTTALNVGEWRLSVPSPEIHFLIASVHAYRHARSLGDIVQGSDFRLSRFVDIAQLLKLYGSCFNWQKVYEVAEQNSLLRTLAFVMAVVDDFWGPQPWPAVLDCIEDDSEAAQEIADAWLFGKELVLGQWSLSPAQRIFQPHSERRADALMALYCYLRDQKQATIVAEDYCWDHSETFPD